MDYIGNKCPVCDKYFHIHDDIVVCPECGTPSHRECYTKNGGCINKDKHAEGYDYNKDESVYKGGSDGNLICKKCGANNDESAFFCNKCGADLNEIKYTQNPYQNTTRNGSAPDMGPNVIFIDPLAGVDKNVDLGDGITAGEYAKYVNQNTPYFINIFRNIKTFKKSRFNFCGLLFGSIYLLYRKMYKIGALFAALEVAIMIATVYLESYITNSGAFTHLISAYQTANPELVLSQFYALSVYDQTMFFLYTGIAFLDLAITLFIGFCANRIYYNHCKKQIKKIKSKVESADDKDNMLSVKGGVNVALTISLIISNIILSVAPGLFM